MQVENAGRWNQAAQRSAQRRSHGPLFGAPVVTCQPKLEGFKNLRESSKVKYCRLWVRLDRARTDLCFIAPTKG